MAATCVVQPIDLIKNRMQLAGEGGSKLYGSSFEAAASIFKSEGVSGMYAGYAIDLTAQVSFLCGPEPGSCGAPEKTILP